MLKAPIKIGTFRLGNLMVAVEAMPDSEGGNFNALPAPTLRIGFLYHDWSEVTGILLHEASEFQLMMLGTKFRNVPLSNYDSADCSFLFNHSQFGRMCADVGAFMAEVMPKLEIVFKKGRKK